MRLALAAALLIASPALAQDKKPDAALAAVNVAAAASVINALMNYDESVVKR